MGKALAAGEIRSHHKVPDNLAEYESGMPDIPDHLSDSAKVHWEKVTQQMDEAGVLSVADADVLAMYCEEYVLWISEKQKLLEEGTIVDGARGGKVKNPRTTLVNSLRTNVITLQKQLGLTPQTRKKITTANPRPKKKAPNRFAALGF